MTAVSISGVLVMVSSELVVLLIVCVEINTGSAQGELVSYSSSLQTLLVPYHCYTLSTELCQATTNICGINTAFDTNRTQCVSTTLNCTNNGCTAVIKTVTREVCQVMNIGANVSLPIHCCMCYLGATNISNLRWGCNIITSFSLSLLPSGE